MFALYLSFVFMNQCLPASLIWASSRKWGKKLMLINGWPRGEIKNGRRRLGERGKGGAQLRRLAKPEKHRGKFARLRWFFFILPNRSSSCEKLLVPLRKNNPAHHTLPLCLLLKQKQLIFSWVIAGERCRHASPGTRGPLMWSEFCCERLKISPYFKHLGQICQGGNCFQSLKSFMMESTWHYLPESYCTRGLTTQPSTVAHAQWRLSQNACTRIARTFLHVWCRLARSVRAYQRHICIGAQEEVY